MPKLVLLVEDDPRDIELTLLALRKVGLGRDLVIVRDGSEALDYLFHRGKFATDSAGRPGVVVLDLKLPKVDGLQVLEQLKREASTSNIPVVMLSASREESDLRRSYDLGVNAYVVKPLDFKEFVSAIQELGTFWLMRNEAPRGATQV